MIIFLHEREPATPINDLTHLDQVIAEVAKQAQDKGILAAIILKANNENELTMAVGGDETVLGFTGAHLAPPYYASKGKGDSNEPVMSCFFLFQHHTEFPRKWIIPFQAGLAAVHEFYQTGMRPECVEWVEV